MPTSKPKTREEPSKYNKENTPTHSKLNCTLIQNSISSHLCILRNYQQVWTNFKQLDFRTEHFLFYNSFLGPALWALRGVCDLSKCTVNFWSCKECGQSGAEPIEQTAWLIQVTMAEHKLWIMAFDYWLWMVPFQIATIVSWVCSQWEKMFIGSQNWFWNSPSCKV